MNLKDALTLLEQTRRETARTLADARTVLNANGTNDAKAAQAVKALTEAAAKAASSMVIVRTGSTREYAADLHDGLVTLWSRYTISDGEWTCWFRTFGLPAASALFGERWSIMCIDSCDRDFLAIPRDSLAKPG